jgi:hypothetical protein
MKALRLGAITVFAGPAQFATFDVGIGAVHGLHAFTNTSGNFQEWASPGDKTAILKHPSAVSFLYVDEIRLSRARRGWLKAATDII